MPCLNRDRIVQLVSHRSLDIVQLISGGTFDKKNPSIGTKGNILTKIAYSFWAISPDVGVTRYDIGQMSR